MEPVYGQLAPDPQARSQRMELLSQDILDALAYAIRFGAFTSAEVHRDATLEDLAHGNGKVRGHLGSTSSRYYTHWDDPEWAVVFDNDCPHNAERGRMLLQEAGLIKEEE